MSEPIFRERLQAIIDWADMAMNNRVEFDRHGVLNLNGPVFDNARVALVENPSIERPDEPGQSVHGTSTTETANVDRLAEIIYSANPLQDCDEDETWYVPWDDIKSDYPATYEALVERAMEIQSLFTLSPAPNAVTAGQGVEEMFRHKKRVHDAVVEAARKLVRTVIDIEMGRSIHNDRKPANKIEGRLWGILSKVRRETEEALAAYSALSTPTPKEESK